MNNLKFMITLTIMGENDFAEYSLLKTAEIYQNVTMYKHLKLIEYLRKEFGFTINFQERIKHIQQFAAILLTKF